MAGVGGIEVGRVHIRVVPDFTRFRKDMAEELAFWEKQGITIKVKADRSELSGLTQDLNKSARQASKGVSKQLTNGINKAGKNAKLAPGLDLKESYKKKLQGQLNTLFDEISVNLNLAKANQGLFNEFDDEFKAAQKKLSKLDPEMDTRLFAADASFVMAKLNEIKQKWIDAERSNTAVSNREAAKRLAFQTLKGEQIKKFYETINYAGSDEGRGKNALQQQIGMLRENLKLAVPITIDDRIAVSELQAKLSGLERALELDIPVDFNLKKAAIAEIIAQIAAVEAAIGAMNLAGGGAAGGKGFGSFLSGLTPQGRGLNVSVAGFLALGSAIALAAAPLTGLLATGLLALPGLLATVLAPIGAVVLGFKGIKDAAMEAGLFGDKNGDKKGGGSLGAALTELQTQVQGVFKDKLKEPFGSIGDVASQYIEPLKSVAAGVADIMAQTINTMTSPENTRKITETFSAIGENLSKSFAPAIADFTEGLINLAHQFTTGGALEGVGTWFKETMADFKEWTSSSDLTTQFSNLGTTLKTVLDTLGAMGREGLAFVGDQQKMDGFLAMLKEVGTALENIVEMSNDIGDIWGGLSRGVDFTQGVVDVMQGDGANAIRNFRAAFDARAKEEGPQMGIDFSKTISEGFKVGLELGNPLTGLSEASAEELNKLAYGIAQAGTKGVEQLKQAITAGDVEVGVAQQIQDKVGAAVTGAMQALEPLKQGLQTDINAALAPLGDIAGKIQSAFGDVAGQVQGALSRIPGIVSNSLGSLGGVTALAMAAVAQEVQKGCDAAVLIAVFSAPKIGEPFKALSGEMAGVGASMMQGLGAGIRDNVGIAKLAAEVAAKEVKEAAKAAIRSQSPSKDFMDIGKDTQTGLAIGINDNAKGPISAIREVMQAIKDVFGSAEGINLNFFMGQAATSMSSMATSSKEFRSNMVEAGTTPALDPSNADTAADLEDIKRQKAEINVRIAELQALKNATTDKAAKAGLQAEMDQLKIQKSRLDLLKEENGLQEERKTAIQKLSDTIATNITDMIKMPGEFAKTTASAAMQDIGISGSGAIPTIANWAADAATNYIFNVNNMDDAIQGQQAQQRKQTAGVVSR